MSGRIEALCIAPERGHAKHQVDRAEFVQNGGIAGDAHFGPGDRQVSIILKDSIIALDGLEKYPAVGAFGENIIISGLSHGQVHPGHRLVSKSGLVLEITQIGKECHDKCEIFETLGVCAMSDEGLFAKVLNSAEVHTGEILELIT